MTRPAAAFHQHATLVEEPVEHLVEAPGGDVVGVFDEAAGEVVLNRDLVLRQRQLRHQFTMYRSVDGSWGA